MKMKLLVVALAAIGAVGSAQAGAVAQSVLQVTNFHLMDGGTSVDLDAGDFSNLFIVDSTNLNPTLTPGGANPYVNQTFGGAPLPLTVRCVPGVCPAALNSGTPFAHAAFPASVNGAMGASSLDGAPITGLGFATGANARASALAERITIGTGDTLSDLTLSSLFTFKLARAGGVKFEFDADLYLLADADTLLNATAGSGWSVNITRQDTGAQVFNWAPNGQAGGIDGGTETTDDCGLTRSITSFGPGGHAVFDSQTSATCLRSNGGLNHYMATTDALAAGVQYNLALTHFDSAKVNVTVPEPSSLLLTGLALAGLGFFGVRRKA